MQARISEKMSDLKRNVKDLLKVIWSQNYNNVKLVFIGFPGRTDDDWPGV